MSLSVGLRVHGLLLIDQATGACHRLAADARRPAEALMRPVLVQDWLARPDVQRLGYGPALGLLHNINDIAGLTIQSSRRIYSIYWRLRLVAMGAYPSRPAYRHSTSIAGLIHVVAVASLPIIAAATIGMILAYGANVSMPGFVQTQLLFLASLLASTAVHEAAHWWLAGSGMFIRRGLRLGLLHPPLSPRKELVSAVVGPLAGMLCAVCFWLFLATLGTTIFGHVSLMLVMVFHACSWLPWYGDGQALWNRERYA